MLRINRLLCTTPYPLILTGTTSTHSVKTSPSLSLSSVFLVVRRDTATIATIPNHLLELVSLHSTSMSIIGSMIYFGHPVLLRTSGISYRILSERTVRRLEIKCRVINKVPFFTAGSRLDPRYPVDFFIRWIPPKSGRSLIFLKIEIPRSPTT